MEKICIVRRRKKSVQGDGKEANRTADRELTPDQGLDVVLSQVAKKDITADGKGKSSVDELVGDKNEMISFNLTDEQCELIQTGDFAQYLSSGISKGTAVNVQQEDGKISLNFYFDHVNTLRMLKTKHVCEMLEISESFLRKLIKQKKLKSYKIGSARRFSFEDILEFLTRNEYLDPKSKA